MRLKIKLIDAMMDDVLAIFFFLKKKKYMVDDALFSI
jgi:hypothetical protein